MIHLFRAELSRALSRRLTKALLILSFLAIALTAILTTIVTETPSESDRKAPQRLEQAIAECVESSAQDSFTFTEDAGGTVTRVPDQTRDAAQLQEDTESCRQSYAGSEASFRNVFEYTSVSTGPLHEGPLSEAMTLVVGLAFLLGASLVGADWRSGHMITLLLWEPRRVRLAAVRLSAVALVGFVFALLTAATLALSLALVATFHGSTDGVTDRFITDMITGILRTSVMAAGLASFGGALALLVRNSAGALAVVVVGWIMSGMLFDFRPQWLEWSPADNFTNAFFAGSFIGFEFGVEFEKSALASGATLLFYLALTVIIAMVTFKKREVGSSS